MDGYELYQIEPNTICEGAKVFTKSFYFDTDNDYKNRLIRVYLPSSYDFSNPHKRFKTIYMFDGKNLFDDYTSFVGEWGIDESIEKMIKENKSEGYIVIGIDAPNEDLARSLEMSPDNLIRNKKYFLNGNGYASKLGKFLFEVVKPDIDKNFYTLPDKKNTGVGGSSMGGIMSFYIGMEYKDKVQYCLNFSPAFFLFTWNSFKKYLDEKVDSDCPKQFFYVGGKGFERVFVDSTIKTYNYFINHNFSLENVKLIIDVEKEHNEKAWKIYFPQALESIDK